MNDDFRFFIHVNYGMHHVYVETTHKDFTKYVDDMSTEFTIHKELKGNCMYVWIENYHGDRDNLGYILELA